jgi:hypothetical protein
MRCMTLAIAFNAIGWIALGSLTIADETTAIDISSSTSSRISYVTLASDQQVAEISSQPQAPLPLAQPETIPGDASGPSKVTQGQDLATIHGYRSPLPFGPSGTPSILQFMACDPHSCPNLWQGYEAQRAADLARKCSPHGCCSCGGNCGGFRLHGSPCMTCANRPAKIVNRYRPTPSSGCSTCGNLGCDGLNHDAAPNTNSDAASTLTIKAIKNDQLSELPNSDMTR